MTDFLTLFAAVALGGIAEKLAFSVYILFRSLRQRKAAVSRLEGFERQLAEIEKQESDMLADKPGFVSDGL